MSHLETEAIATAIKAAIADGVLAGLANVSKRICQAPSGAGRQRYADLIERVEQSARDQSRKFQARMAVLRLDPESYGAGSSMITDQEIRLECLKLAAAIASNQDPRRAAEALFEYVKFGLSDKGSSQPTACPEGPRPAAADRQGEGLDA